MRSSLAKKLVKSIKAGDTEEIRSLLAEQPELAQTLVGDNPRTMLHYATDWPGHFPNVATTIEMLVAAGADPNAGSPHPENPIVSETPLHWAVSSGDVAAAKALIDAGANVDAQGGIFDGCLPLEEAIIFEKYDAARLLLDHGATPFLPGAAALGQLEDVRGFFDAGGALIVENTWMPNWSADPNAQMVLDASVRFACRAGHLEVAQFLVAHGANLSSVSPVGGTSRDWAEENEHPHVVNWIDETLAQG